jgi:hypothetical protein
VELIEAHGQFINWGISPIESQRCDPGDHDRSPRPFLVVHQKEWRFSRDQKFIRIELTSSNEMIATTLAVENDYAKFCCRN